MFRDQVAEEKVHQEEVQGQESTRVPMAGPMCRMILLASSQAIGLPGVFNRMPTQLQWRGLLPTKEEQEGQEWQLQWQGCGQGDMREEQEQVDKGEGLEQVVKEEKRGQVNK